MLSEHHIVNLIDRSGKHNFTAEVNWNPEDAKSNKSKVIRLKCSDGKEAYVTREDLLQFFFAIGTPEQQQKLMPQTLTKMRWYETILTVKAHKDIRRGEEVTFPVKLSLPPIEDEVVSAIAQSKTRTSFPIIGQTA